MKKVFTFVITIVLLSALIISAGASPAGDKGPNLIDPATATATASANSEYSANYAAKNAFDGDIATRWASRGTDLFGQPAVLTIDLGSAKTFNTISINEYHNKTLEFTVEISNDNTSWTKAFTGGKIFLSVPGIEESASGFIGNTDNLYIDFIFETVTARYLKITFICKIDLANPAANEPSIREIQLYNILAAGTNPPDTTAAPETATVPGTTAISGTTKAAPVTNPQTSDFIITAASGMLIAAIFMVTVKKRTKIK